MSSDYNPEPSLSPLGDILARFWRHRIKAATSFFLILAATMGYTAVAKPTYKSYAQLNVKVGRNSASLDPTVTTGQFVAVADPREAEINAVSDLIKSQAIIETMIDQLGEDVVREKEKKEGGGSRLQPGKMLAFLDPFNLNPFRVYSTRDDAIKRVSKQLKVTTSRNSSVITLVYQSKSPELAKLVLETLVEIVRDRHTQVNKTRGSHQFFEEERSKAQVELVALETKRMELKNSTGLADFATQREKTLGRVRYLEDEIGDTQAKLVAAESELKIRGEMLKNIPATIVTEETTGEVASLRDNMREELFRLENREKELLSKFTEDSIYVKMVRDQLEKARSIVQSEKVNNKVTRGVSKPFEEMQIAVNNVKAERDSLQSKLNQLTEQLTAAQERLKLINDKERDFLELDRNIQLADTKYREYHRAHQQTVVDQGMEEQKITNINLLQDPTYSNTPSSPNALLNIAMGLGLSFLTSIGVVTAVDKRRNEGGEAMVEQRPQPTNPTPDVVPETVHVSALTPVTLTTVSADDVPDLTPPPPRPLPR